MFFENGEWRNLHIFLTCQLRNSMHIWYLVDVSDFHVSNFGSFRTFGANHLSNPSDFKPKIRDRNATRHTELQKVHQTTSRQLLCRFRIWTQKSAHSPQSRVISQGGNNQTTVSELGTQFWPQKPKLVPTSLPYGGKGIQWLNSFVCEI